MSRQTTSPNGIAYYQASDAPDGAAQGQDTANTVQTALNTKLNLAGGTVTGAVSVPTPTADAHAATKLYVDGKGIARGGVVSVTTGADGSFLFAHGMDALPSSVIVQLGVNTAQVRQLGQVTIQTRDATNVSGYVTRTDTGAGLASTQVQLYWIGTTL